MHSQPSTGIEGAIPRTVTYCDIATSAYSNVTLHNIHDILMVCSTTMPSTCSSHAQATATTLSEMRCKCTMSSLSTHSSPGDKKKVKGTEGVANDEADNTIDKRKRGKGNRCAPPFLFFEFYSQLHRKTSATCANQDAIAHTPAHDQL